MVCAWLRRVGGGRPEAVAVLLPVLVMTAVGLWGLDRGGMWRDEAVTFQVAQRSVPQIWHLLHTVDAVHGLYYLLMHPVLAAHPGEFALRLPSVCGAAAAAGGVAALGVRLCRPRVGLWAGLLYAVTPMAGHYAQEGRSYALVAAGAVGATLLLVRAARTRRTGGWWAAYGGTVAVTCLLHELAALVLLAHAGTLALARVRARVWSRWACAAGAAVVALVPLVLVSRGQSAQVAWLTPPGPGSVGRLLGAFTGPALPVTVPYLLLAALAVRPSRLRYGGLSLPAVALPLTVVPPAVLMTVSHAWPLYDERYVLYALAGAPLLAGAGAERAATLIAGAGVRARARGRVDAGLRSSSAARGARLLAGVRRRARPRPAGATAVTLTGVLTLALAFAAQLPLMRRDRTPEHHGADNLAAVSAAARRALRPGDPVLYLPSIVRRSALAYPRGFRGVRDVALRVPGPASGTLYGQEAGPDELRRRLTRLDRVWMVAEPFALSPSWYPHSATERVKLAVVEEQFVPREQVVREGVTLRLYVRRAPPAG
ncbi:glycosyltransferase family 39 protein [Streptomyces sp. NPDC005813]|uniref:glycosyltransferase family 39 protein n=1 Tax=Streptomyces sp. NPDC005813 TaxID=3155592 RepID=UPI0033CB9D08